MTKNSNHLDDSRTRSDTDPKGKAKTLHGKAPLQGEEDQATVEEFDREGMGVSAKE